MDTLGKLVPGHVFAGAHGLIARVRLALVSTGKIFHLARNVKYRRAIHDSDDKGRWQQGGVVTMSFLGSLTIGKNYRFLPLVGAPIRALITPHDEPGHL